MSGNTVRVGDSIRKPIISVKYALYYAVVTDMFHIFLHKKMTQATFHSIILANKDNYKFVGVYR